ncbi:MAG TPA: hypothetical protein VFE78_09505 [Gemmataceae bacterium]|nr:hypothetical protein [Gemmataceae bacterium]
MRKLIAGLAIAGLVALSGCHNTSSTGGGPAAGGGTFKLEGPKMTTDVKQGETKDIAITVDRSKTFTEDVTLSVDYPKDKNFTVTADPATLKNSENAPLHLKVTAKDDAALGTYDVKVTGKPAKGSVTLNPVTVPIKIVKK